jgi:hypothetical protein
VSVGTGGLASVGGVTTTEDRSDGGARLLEFPPEPEDLRTGLRDALLAGDDWREGFSDDICIGVWLWSHWQPALEPAGCTREDFIDIVVAGRRELWLWLLGDRRWDQYVSGLAGRVIRRLPTAAR